MKRSTISLLVILMSASASIAQFSDPGADLLKPLPVDPALTNLPPITSDGPIHELPSLLSNGTATKMITKRNQMLRRADFKVEMRRGTLVSSNLVVDIAIERKYKLENLQTVDLYVGGIPNDGRLLAMHGAELFATLWLFPAARESEPFNNPVHLSFTLSVDVAKKAFLLLECQSRSDTGHNRLRIGPTTLYAIDLSSFMPLSTKPRWQDEHAPEDEEDGELNIDFVKRTASLKYGTS